MRSPAARAPASRRQRTLAPLFGKPRAAARGGESGPWRRADIEAKPRRYAALAESVPPAARFASPAPDTSPHGRA